MACCMIEIAQRHSNSETNGYVCKYVIFVINKMFFHHVAFSLEPNLVLTQFQYVMKMSLMIYPDNTHYTGNW